MSAYPENQTYCIVPIADCFASVGNVLSVARKSIDQKFMVWHYEKKSPCLDTLKKNVNIKLLTHSQVLNLMASDIWQAKESPTFN